MHPKRDWLGIENKIQKDCFCKKSTESLVCLHLPRRIEKTDKGKEQRVFTSGLWLKRWTPTTNNHPQTHPRQLLQGLPAKQHVRRPLRVQNAGKDWWRCSTWAVHLLLSSPQKLLQLGSILATWGLRSSFASETLHLLSPGLNTLPSHSHMSHSPNSSESLL